MSLLDIADDALGWVRKRSPGIQAEVYLCRVEDRGVERRGGRLENLQESAEEGMSLRLVADGRMGFAYAGGLGPDVLPMLFKQASDQLRHVPGDEHRVLPSPEGPDPEGAALGETLYDESLFTGELREAVGRLAEAEERARAKDGRIKKIVHSGYGEARSEVAIASTTGLRALERQTSCSVGMSAAADGEGEVQVGSASRSARRARDLDFLRVAEESAWRTVALLDSRKLPSRRRAVLFDPWVAGEFLEVLAGALCADAVQKGKSLFRGKVGKTVASPKVTLVDDPLRPGGLASARYDDEGVPTRRKVMVEKGVLRGFFYDSYAGHKDGCGSNGSAGRPSFKGLPSPTHSNLFLAPGGLSREQLIRETEDGALVFEVMGMHTADSVSGEFSIGVSGVAIRDGEIAHGIRGAMLSGNILDVLQSVDAVADDLTFYGGLAAPTFRAAGLTVA